jgi:protein-L-isoaspartate(D-aspartate) O-methyltransferase
MSWFLLPWLFGSPGCANGRDHPDPAATAGAPEGKPVAVKEPIAPRADESPGTVASRQRMVREQIEARGVRNPIVLEAMRKMPRHLLVPERLEAMAYDDGPLPIGEGQTISQPYIVALMTELLELSPGQKVLEVGTGSGYQAAVLAEMGLEVYTIEIVEPLAREARRRLEEIGYTKIRFRIGDGYRGWEEAAPFDGIVVTAAPDHVPQPLVDQLRVGGRLVIPVGATYQELLVITRTETGVRRDRSIPVRFVPMTGEALDRPH